ncbi:MAG TPA: HD-GYP domain-containing protein, partial [Symbiobacteriaceae bacterium]|nr:HD-GYP domain-containing protein [Symbiobacteriaceae bacterium]
MKRRQMGGVLAVVMMALGWWLVNRAGGTISAVTHVMYVPIVLSALAWGPVGGVAAGAVAAGLMAMTPVSVATGQIQTLASVAIRGGAFVAVGCLVGYSVLRNARQQREMQRLIIQSVTALTNAMSATHEQTARHSLRVAEICASLGQQLRLDEQRLFILRMGSLLHDIGKLAVPLEILDKPGRLTADEYGQVKEHAVTGATILGAFDYSRIGAVQDMVRHHHERLDGSGYPDGLKGGEISLLTRVVAVADVYDALTSNRSYRVRMSHAEAMLVLRQEVTSGRLDGRLVEMLDRIPQSVV